MIKPKAPKDMTATEFVAHLELIASREMLAKNLEGWAITLQGLHKELSEPAPNPFTQDQIAWMRVEQEYNGVNYVVADRDGEIVFFGDRPRKTVGCDRWLSEKGHKTTQNPKTTFMRNFVSWYDPEPLCFADYAPPEEK